MRQLRCGSGTLFAEVFDPDEIEVRCRNRRCGYEPGVLVLHRFCISTGAVLGTSRYRDAAELKEEDSATNHTAAAVRSA